MVALCLEQCFILDILALPVSDRLYPLTIGS